MIATILPTEDQQFSRPSNHYKSDDVVDYHLTRCGEPVAEAAKYDDISPTNGFDGQPTVWCYVSDSEKRQHEPAFYYISPYPSTYQAFTHYPIQFPGNDTYLPTPVTQSVCSSYQVNQQEFEMTTKNSGIIQLAPFSYQTQSPSFAASMSYPSNVISIPPPTFIAPTNVSQQQIPAADGRFNMNAEPTSTATSLTTLPHLVRTSLPHFVSSVKQNTPVLVQSAIPVTTVGIDPAQLIMPSRPVVTQNSPPMYPGPIFTCGGSGNQITAGEFNIYRNNVKEQQLLEFISSANSANMHIVWHTVFNLYFDQFKGYQDCWDLFPIENIESLKYKHIVKDSAKVRFLCKSCANAWTSMKGRIMFRFERDDAARKGSVFFQLFGQQCDKCKNGRFEHAMWYPEEVHKVLSNIFNHVGERYYGFKLKVVRTERRPGKPRTAHNSKLCQACAIGCCYETSNTAKTQPITCC